ncbi:MAG: DNA/RNA nuclease SfsA [Gammaproteobacteria bacterium]|nr:DNA/RNA nuclease SfsA [Gammaproteobacteria bacterium]
MKFATPLQEARLIKRYKRFLADVVLADGSTTTLHCPNTGSMLNCAAPGSRVWYSVAENAARKYPFTWEQVEVDGGHRVGINTGRANTLVKEALQNDVIPALRGYAMLQSEVAYGSEGSRVDFLLSGGGEEPLPSCYLEVKSVTLGLGDGLGAFPDAVTARGLKHLRELVAMRESGQRAVLLFCVQHTGIDTVVPADRIDPVYGRALREARAAGVEVMAWGCDIGSQEIILRRELPVQMP